MAQVSEAAFSELQSTVRKMQAELVLLRALRDKVVDRRERTTVRAQPNDSIRAVAGMTVVLPAAKPAKEQTVRVLVESQPVTILADDDSLVNAQAEIVVTTPGLVECTSSGQGWWTTAAGGAEGGGSTELIVDADVAVGAAIALSKLATIPFSSITLQAFTTVGANTYTPTTGMKFCIVFTTGSGGGGGGADCAAAANVAVGGGGGAGGTCIEGFSAATIGASQTVTIGAGGTAGANTGTNGGAGGNTTFGALHTANGGAGGVGSGTSAVNVQTTAGGLGGVPTGGLINITGGSGKRGFALLTLDATDTNEVSLAVGGHGGASFWGDGGLEGGVAQDAALADSTGASSAGSNGLAFGSGAGGGAALNSTTGIAGGVGCLGCCLVIEFI